MPLTLTRSSGDYVLATDGSVWFYEESSGQWLTAPITLPVPASQVQFIEQSSALYYWLIDKNGNLWVGDTGAAPWQNYGQPPGSPVPTESNTWGSVKGKYEGEE